MRLSTGIPGLDSVIGGGIPKGHIITIFGHYGTGKTTFGLHFVYEGLKNGERCIFISLDEDEASIIETAQGFGMDFNEYYGQIEIIRLDPLIVKESLEKINNDLMQIISEMKASRLVIDTISILEGLFSESDRWRTISFLKNSIKKSGITAILTSEADRYTMNTSKYGILEYISDGAIALKYVRKNELEEPILGLEVIKMRRTKHSRKLRPFTITERGIEVYEEAEIF